MLEIIEYNKDEYAFPSLLVLGCFDAIHAGHRELFKKAKLQAKINGLDLGIMMFRDGKGGRQVYSFDERVRMLEKFNVKFVLVVDYTPEFMATMPLDFLHNLEEKINIKAYMSGKDFRFGKGAKGKSATLKKYAEDEENGVWYMPVKEVLDGGEKISTTKIKEYLDCGDVIKAGELLGENFFVEGEVIRGAGRGGEVLGFRTANIEYPEWKYPVKCGVYRVKSMIGEIEYEGIANYGTCPTFDDDRQILEVYFIGFEGDLYGKTLKIEFVSYIRDINKFETPEALANQLAADASFTQPAAYVETATDEVVPAEEVTEEITEEVVPAEEVTEEITEEVVPAEEVTEEITEEVVPAEEVTEEVTDEVVPVEEVTEEVTDEVVPVEEVAEEVTEYVIFADDTAKEADEITEEATSADDEADETVEEKEE